MVIEPRVWDIPGILGSFVISNAGVIPVVPYAGRVSPGLSGAAATLPLIRPGRTPYLFRDRRRSGLALTKPRRESDQLDLSWMLVRECDPAIESPPRGFASYEAGVVAEMLEAICKRAGTDGMVSVFARIPDECPYKSVFEGYGFSAVVREHTYGRGGAGVATPALLPGLRRQARPDAWGIQQLYRAITPVLVQRAENLTSRTWDLPGRRRFAGFRRPRPDLRFVVEAANEIAAWLKVTPGEDGPHRLRLMAPQNEPGMTQALLDFGLASLRRYSPRSVLAVVRDHDVSLLRTLEENGFRPVYTRLLMVRHLGIRLFKPLPQAVAERAAN